MYICQAVIYLLKFAGNGALFCQKKTEDRVNVFETNPGYLLPNQ